jgi:hypothetical protein
MAAAGTKCASRAVTLAVVGLSLAVLVALTACSGGSDEPVASAPTPTTSETDSAPRYWQDDPTPAEAKADLKYGGVVVFAGTYAFEISRLARGDEATVNMQNKALRSAVLNMADEYYDEIEVQILSSAGRATVAISKDGLCATFTVPNSNRGSTSDLSYAAAPATATAGEGNEAPTCT